MDNLAFVTVEGLHLLARDQKSGDYRERLTPSPEIQATSGIIGRAKNVCSGAFWKYSNVSRLLGPKVCFPFSTQRRIIVNPQDSTQFVPATITITVHFMAQFFEPSDLPPQPLRRRR
jgi:hypothetical protein